MEKELELIRKGAEAYLYKSTLLGIPVIVKYRVPKAYRDKVLDQRIRSQRTILEAKIIGVLRVKGIPVPGILLVDPENAIIVLEYIEGILLKQAIGREDFEIIRKVFNDVGYYVGLIHKNKIVHGDLTTSNIIIRNKDKKPYIIDFGLAMYSDDIEDRGVDLHLFLRSLESTHPRYADTLFQEFIRGYSKIMGDGYTKAVLDKVKEIRMRGRYVEERRLKRI